MHSVTEQEFKRLDYEVMRRVFTSHNQLGRNLPLAREGISLGTQRVHLTADNVGFKLTAVIDPADHVESHLRRFLALTGLRALQWINYNRHSIEFVTLVQ